MCCMFRHKSHHQQDDNTRSTHKADKSKSPSHAVRINCSGRRFVLVSRRIMLGQLVIDP